MSLATRALAHLGWGGWMKQDGKHKLRWGPPDSALAPIASIFLFFWAGAHWAPRGPNGPMGPKGPIGPMGPMGPRAQWAQWAQWAQRAQGPNGPKWARTGPRARAPKKNSYFLFAPCDWCQAVGPRIVWDTLGFVLDFQASGGQKSY